MCVSRQRPPPLPPFPLGPPPRLRRPPQKKVPWRGGSRALRPALRQRPAGAAASARTRRLCPRRRTVGASALAGNGCGGAAGWGFRLGIQCCTPARCATPPKRSPGAGSTGKSRAVTVQIMKRRIFSALVAAAYLPLAYDRFGINGTCSLALYLLLPLSCIWFSRTLGGYAGGDYARVSEHTKPTPPPLVAFCGWLLLALPAVVWAIIRSGGR